MIETIIKGFSLYWELPGMLVDYLGRLDEENAVLAVGIVLAMLLVLYTVTILLVKWALLDNIFPFLHIRDRINNRILVARVIYGSRDNKISRLKNSDTLHIKTSLLPFFDTLPVKIGDNQWRYRWWRSYTVENNHLKQIVWNDDIQAFKLQFERIGIDEEKLDGYLIDAKKELKNVSTGVTTGVQGDYNLIKDRYYLSIPHPTYDEEEHKEDKR